MPPLTGITSKLFEIDALFGGTGTVARRGRGPEWSSSGAPGRRHRGPAWNYWQSLGKPSERQQARWAQRRARRRASLAQAWPRPSGPASGRGLPRARSWKSIGPQNRRGALRADLRVTGRKRRVQCTKRNNERKRRRKENGLERFESDRKVHRNLIKN